MLRKLYLSPLWIFISLGLRFLSLFQKPFMVYGFYNRVEGKYYRRTRIGSNVKLSDKNKIDIKDNVWIGYYSLLDGIGGITIGTGVNIASHTCIYTHSSQNAIRMMGDKFIEVEAKDRAGYIIEPVSIGDYTFVGTSSIILSGTHIGKGCIVGAGSVVKGVFPDYSVIVGNPAKIVGDTREVDAELVRNGVSTADYYDSALLNKFK